jgi:hypothetical protein
VLFTPFGLIDQIHEGQDLGPGRRREGQVPLVLIQLLPEELFYQKMFIPAMDGPGAGEAPALASAVGKRDFMAQLAAPDPEIVSGRFMIKTFHRNSTNPAAKTRRHQEERRIWRSSLWLRVLVADLL